jgi:predicted transcriptional regulator
MPGRRPKLTREALDDIKSSKEPQSKLVKRYGITQAYVSQIQNGKVNPKPKATKTNLSAQQIQEQSAQVENVSLLITRQLKAYRKMKFLEKDEVVGLATITRALKDLIELRQITKEDAKTLVSMMTDEQIEKELEEK